MHPLFLLSPFPLIDEKGEQFDGYKLPVGTYCRSRCKDHACTTLGSSAHDSPMYFTCPQGFSVATVKIADIPLVVHGVLEAETNTAPAWFKKGHKNRKLKKQEFEDWITVVRQAMPYYDTAVQEAASNSIATLHEIKAMVGTIQQTSEQLVAQQPGYTIEEKVENSPEQLRTLYHSCRVCCSLLQMMDIIPNPDSAWFGNPRPTVIYKIFHMLARIFKAKARRHSVDIQLLDSSYNAPSVRWSFIIIPLVLIDNAIKHSHSNSVIKIHLADGTENQVHAKILSNGPLIPEDEREAVFKRGFRASNAHRPGSGLGLFIASIVAQANQTKIVYRALPPEKPGQTDLNEFSFSVRNVVCEDE